VIGLVLVAVGGGLWGLALRDYRAGLRQTLSAVRLLLRGRESPPMSDALAQARSTGP
jgi:hypothetical protein